MDGYRKQERMEFEYDGGFYESIGNFLKENYLSYGFTQGTVQEVQFLTEVMELAPGAAILDIGCGPGRHSLELARRGFRPTGIDISAEFIRYAERKAEELQLDASFAVADARGLQFDGQFEAAVCLCEGAFGLAGSEGNHRKVLQGIRRALKPGSPFVLTVIHALNLARNITADSVFDAYSCTVTDNEEIVSPEGEAKRMDIHTTAFTYRELKLLLESEGFEVQAAYGCSAGHFSTQRLTVDSVEICMIAARKE